MKVRPPARKVVFFVMDAPCCDTACYRTRQDRSQRVADLHSAT